jgi:hypothetical protein
MGGVGGGGEVSVPCSAGPWQKRRGTFRPARPAGLGLGRHVTQVGWVGGGAALWCLRPTTGRPQGWPPGLWRQPPPSLPPHQRARVEWQALVVVLHELCQVEQRSNDLGRYRRRRERGLEAADELLLRGGVELGPARHEARGEQLARHLGVHLFFWGGGGAEEGGWGRGWRVRGLVRGRGGGGARPGEASGGEPAPAQAGPRSRPPFSPPTCARVWQARSAGDGDCASSSTLKWRIHSAQSSLVTLAGWF